MCDFESRLRLDFFTRLMQRISPGVSADQVKACFEQVAGADGKATFSEFVDFLCSGSSMSELRERAKNIYRCMIYEHLNGSQAASEPSPELDSIESWRMHGKCSPVFAEYLALCQNEGYANLIDISDKQIGKDDALIIVDMQNDFIPKDDVNEHGRLPATEGADISDQIVQMAELFASRGGVVVATRDYHPVDHASFVEQGGKVLTHCVQGSGGADFYKPIGDCLARLMEDEQNRVEVVFKGFHENVESFGSFTYSEVPPADRDDEFACTSGCPQWRCFGCASLVDWTGSFALKCSGLRFEGRINVNAPPDVLATYNRVSLAQRLREQGIRRVFTCGLVFDLCVTDTSLNAVKAGFKDVYLVMDASRPIHVPGLGKIGSGFVNDIGRMRQRMHWHGVKLVPTASVVDGFTPSNPLLAAEGKIFPLALGPLKHEPVKSLKIEMLGDFSEYEVSPRDTQLQDALRAHNVSGRGSCSKKHVVTLGEAARTAFHIPSSARSFLWCNPLSDFGNMHDLPKSLLSIMSVEAAFLLHGGFLYFDETDKLVASCVLKPGEGLQFGSPQPWPQECTAALKGRWGKVAVPALLDKGAVLFAWLNPGEQLAGSSLRNPHGGFAYLFSESLEARDNRSVFFAVA